MIIETDNNPKVNQILLRFSQSNEKTTKRMLNKMSRDHSNYCIS